MKKVIKLDYK